MPSWKTPFKKIKIGQGRKVKSGNDVAILSIGHIGNYAVTACQNLEEKNISTAHYDMRFVKPLDEVLLHEIFGKFDKIVTVEDGCLQGGMGSAIIEFMADHGYHANVIRLGIPDKIIEHGSQDQLYAECQYDTNAIVEACMKLMDEESEVSKNKASA